MEKKEYKELKRLVSKADRINIVNLLDADITNKDNYFSNIIYLRKTLLLSSFFFTIFLS